MVGEDEPSVKTHISNLEKSLGGHGLCLIYNNDSVMLATSPLAKGLVEKLLKEDLEKISVRQGLKLFQLCFTWDLLKEAR